MSLGNTDEGSDDGFLGDVVKKEYSHLSHYLSVHHSFQDETTSPVVNSPHQQLSTL